MLRKVSHFNCLSCDVSYEGDKILITKIIKFTAVLGIINNASKSKLTQISTRLEIHNTLALRILYGSEI
jgi:hypothetical protein